MRRAAPYYHIFLPFEGISHLPLIKIKCYTPYFGLVGLGDKEGGIDPEDQFFQQIQTTENKAAQFERDIQSSFAKNHGLTLWVAPDGYPALDMVLTYSNSGTKTYISHGLLGATVDISSKPHNTVMPLWALKGYERTLPNHEIPKECRRFTVGKEEEENHVKSFYSFVTSAGRRMKTKSGLAALELLKPFISYDAPPVEGYPSPIKGSQDFTIIYHEYMDGKFIGAITPPYANHQFHLQPPKQ